MTRVLASRSRRGRSRVLLLWALSICIATSAGIWTLLAGELPDAPRAPDRQVARQVTNLLRREHLSKHPLDNEMSQRGLKTFLKSLDNWRMYFYQADVDEFMKHQNDLDDMVKEGDISFAYTVFNRFLHRVDERLKTIRELIAMDHDFTTHEEIIKDADLATYPQNEAEARERWRKRIKYDFLVLKGDKKKNANADITELRDRLTRRYNGIAKRWHQTDADELLELFLTSITSSFDPHTTYMSPSSLENFEIQMRLNLDGIGAALSVIDGYTQVSKIIPGGAADKDGRLKPDDKIISVGQGEGGEMIDVVEMKLNDVVDKIRGKAGTVVRLGVTSPGNPEVKIINIVRAKVELKDSEAQEVIFDDIKGPDGKLVLKADGTPLKVGVIDLPSFYMDMAGARRGKQDFKSTTRDVAKILEKFKSEGVDALVLDLRHNGGGSLTEAISLTGLFIDQGPVVQVKDPNGGVQHYDDMESGELWTGPMVVLISKFSASASEILAGAIQDYGRGLIVGDHATHGKGTVQSLMNLGDAIFRATPKPPNLGALKITMQQFYRPNGDSTQKRGVVSDVELPSITNEMKVGESDLEYALEFDKVQAARFTKYTMVNPALIERLKDLSAKRREKSEDFEKQAKKIDRYKEYQTRKTATLNEKEYFDQIKKVNPDEEEEKQIEKASGNDNKEKEVVKRDYYFNEVLNITSDYYKEWKTNRVVKAK